MGKKTPAYFSTDGWESETKKVYQFHGCHWHEHICIQNSTVRQERRYKDTWKINRLIESNG